MERRGGASGACEAPLTGLAIGQPRAWRGRAHSLRGVLRLPGAPSAIPAIAGTGAALTARTHEARNGNGSTVK